MWNPIQGIKKDWSSTNTAAGKVAVCMFYAMTWFIVMGNLYQSFIDPGTFGQDCAFGSGKTSTAYLILVVRLWAYAVAMLFAYISFIGAKIWNIGFVTFVAWLGNGFIVIFAGSSIRQISKEDEACSKAMTGIGWPMEALFVITFLLMLYDIKNNRNASDYQALA
jgi:hypothetical protein